MTSFLLLGLMAATFTAVSAASAWCCVWLAPRLPRLRSSSRHAGALVLLPGAVGVAVAISMVSPLALLGACHCVAHPHHVHLCFEHGSFSWPLGYMALLGTAALLWHLRRVAGVLRGAIATERWGDTLNTRTTESGVAVSPDLGAQAVTVGIWRPRALLGASLWSSLGWEGRRAVLAHENAHVARRDLLTLLALQLAASLLPLRLGAQLLGSWKLAAEIACDRIAAHQLGDACAMADALVACGKLQLATPARALPRGVLAAVGDADLEVRVARLLAVSASPVSLRGDLLAVCSAAVALAILIAVLAGSSAHHAVETILGWVS